MMVPPSRHHHHHQARHRSKTELIFSILSEAEKHPKGVGRTRLMYSAEISARQLRKYALMLEENKLIKIRQATRQELVYNLQVNHYFTITNKGRLFLKLYSGMEIGNIIWNEQHQKQQKEQEKQEQEVDK